MNISFFNDEETVTGLSLQEEILISISLDPHHFRTKKKQLLLVEATEERVVSETLHTKLNLLPSEFI